MGKITDFLAFLLNDTDDFVEVREKLQAQVAAEKARAEALKIYESWEEQMDHTIRSAKADMNQTDFENYNYHTSMQDANTRNQMKLDNHEMNIRLRAMEKLHELKERLGQNHGRKSRGPSASDSDGGEHAKKAHAKYGFPSSS